MQMYRCITLFSSLFLALYFERKWKLLVSVSACLLSWGDLQV